MDDPKQSLPPFAACIFRCRNKPIPELATILCELSKGWMHLGEDVPPGKTPVSARQIDRLSSSLEKTCIPESYCKQFKKDLV